MLTNSSPNLGISSPFFLCKHEGSACTLRTEETPSTNPKKCPGSAITPMKTVQASVTSLNLLLRHMHTCNNPLSVLACTAIPLLRYKSEDHVYYSKLLNKKYYFRTGKFGQSGAALQPGLDGTPVHFLRLFSLIFGSGVASHELLLLLCYQEVLLLLDNSQGSFLCLQTAVRCNLHMHSQSYTSSNQGCHIIHNQLQRKQVCGYTYTGWSVQGDARFDRSLTTAWETTLLQYACSCFLPMRVRVYKVYSL